MFGLLGGLLVGGGILVSLALGSAILDELTESERDTQRYLQDEFEDYREQKSLELKEIERYKEGILREIDEDTNDKLSNLKRQHELRVDQLKQNYYKKMSNEIEEITKNKEKLLREIEGVKQKVFIVKKGQITMLRSKSLDYFLFSLDETYSRTKAYLQYLQKYKKSLDWAMKTGRELPEPFDFKLPEDFPHFGELLYIKKKELKEFGKLSTSSSMELNYHCIDIDVVSQYDDESEIPFLIDYFETHPNYAYVLSCAKGIFKSTALYQPRVGFKGKVVSVERRKVTLEYKGLTLILSKRDLENPRQTPIRGTELRVFPLRWDYGLRGNIYVTEKFEDSLGLMHFEDLPLVFNDEDYRDFIYKVRELGLEDSLEEWKIAPYDEKELPNIERVKLQLGSQLIIKGIIEGKDPNRKYIRYEGILDGEHSLKADDIFVGIDTTLQVITFSLLDKVAPEEYESMNDLIIFIHQEFKTQQAIKQGGKGSIFFNKWAEVTSKLIGYLQKGKEIQCQLEDIYMDRPDRISGIPTFVGIIKNEEEIEKYLMESKTNYTDHYFLEFRGKRYPVEFMVTGRRLRIIGYFPLDKTDKEELKTLTIYHKNYPYPEIQQNEALNLFRQGELANSKLKQYLINNSTIEYESMGIEIDKFNNPYIEKNQFQKEAVAEALDEKNLFVIQGPPGTGKTTVIKEIIQQHIRCFPYHKIVVVSQANVAVDNVLRGLLEDNTLINENDFIRWGNPGSVDNAVEPVSFENRYNQYLEELSSKDYKEENLKYVKKWKEVIYSRDGLAVIGEILIEGHKIIGATCIGLSKEKIGLNNIVFDLAIIDEAGRALPGELLIPIIRAKKVIMIGDHKQLPPTIHPVLYDPENLDISDPSYCKEEIITRNFFGEIFKSSPETNKAMLKTQFRMPDLIGTMVSNIFYDGELENGLSTYEKKPVFFESTLNFLDMSHVPDYREKTIKGQNPHNILEARIVCQLIGRIRNTCQDKIAVITPYRYQKNIIRNLLKEKGFDIHALNIAVDTVDAYQGDEAEIVLYCTTRSTKKTLFFALPERINVALSRTKRELLIIGSIKYFESYDENEPLYRIAKYVKENGKIYNPEELGVYQDRRNLHE